jgi:hypothetical protein
MRRGVLLLLLAVGAVPVLSSCSTPNPDMTFFASGTSVSVAPVQYCDRLERHCAANGDAAASLTVRGADPVQISAPEEVAATPWQVAARFKGANGDEYVSCSPLFPAGQRYAYTVTPPRAGDQLVLIEVYQISATMFQMPNGDIVTPARGTWVLTANTGGQRVLPKPGDNLCSTA